MLWTIVDLTMIEGILLNWRRHWISWAQNLIFVAKIEKMLQLKDFCGWRPIWVRCLFNLVFWVLLCTQAFGFILFFSFLVSLSLILDSSFMSEAEPSSVASWADIFHGPLGNRTCGPQLGTDTEQGDGGIAPVTWRKSGIFEGILWRIKRYFLRLSPKK